MTDLPIYSPTETDDFLLCPRLRLLKRHFRPRGSAWTPHRALGNAIHAGLADHFVGGDGFGSAFTTLVAEFQEGSEWTLEGCKKLVEKGLKLALGTELLSPDGKVIAVEEWHSRSKIDLVTREPFGLQVTDHKVVLDLQKDRLHYRIRDLDPSWQLLHCAWAVRQKFGECPKWSRAHLIVLGPRPFTHIHSVGPLDDARLDDFERSGTRHWGTMSLDSLECVQEASDGSGPEMIACPPMNTRSCSTQYGRKCDFYDGCHLYGGDLEKFGALYSRGGKDEDHS